MTNDPSPPPSDRRRLLVVSATVGSGHNSVARALIEQFRRAAPNVRTESVDVMQFASRAFRSYYAGGFALGMTALPRAFGMGFAITNRPQRPTRSLIERTRLAMEWAAMSRFREYLLANRFDAILHTHFLAPPVVDRMIQQGLLTLPQFVAVTDVEVHRFWYSRGVDHWFVPSEHSSKPFIRWGIDSQRITVSGIPIHPKWSEPLDRRQIFQDWRLPGDRAIVLLSGGTEFTCGPVVQIARQIVTAYPRAYVVVLAGRNKQLLADVAAMDESPVSIVGIGFTDRIHELAEVCSLMVTKPGGVTTAECLAKGVAMVLTNPVPGHEGGNAEWLCRHGAGAIARTPEDIAGHVAALLNDPPRLAAMSAGARGLYRPGAATVAAAVAAAMG